MGAHMDPCFTLISGWLIILSIYMEDCGQKVLLPELCVQGPLSLLSSPLNVIISLVSKYFNSATFSQAFLTKFMM
jgi:hypothetical protein